MCVNIYRESYRYIECVCLYVLTTFQQFSNIRKTEQRKLAGKEYGQLQMLDIKEENGSVVSGRDERISSLEME